MNKKAAIKRALQQLMQLTKAAAQGQAMLGYAPLTGTYPKPKLPLTLGQIRESLHGDIRSTLERTKRLKQQLKQSITSNTEPPPYRNVTEEFDRLFGNKQ